MGAPGAAFALPIEPRGGPVGRRKRLAGPFDIKQEKPPPAFQPLQPLCALALRAAKGEERERKEKGKERLATI